MIVPEAIEALLQRARGEYLEMPGLRLTLAQAARLWDLDRTTCQRLLHALTHARFLARTADDAYVVERPAEYRPTDHRTPAGDRATAGSIDAARSPERSESRTLAPSVQESAR